MDIIAKAFDLVGLSTEMIGNFLWFVLGLAALGIYTIFKFCRRKFHSDYERGRKRAINKIRGIVHLYGRPLYIVVMG